MNGWIKSFKWEMVIGDQDLEYNVNFLESREDHLTMMIFNKKNGGCLVQAEMNESQAEELKDLLVEYLNERYGAKY